MKATEAIVPEHKILKAVELLREQQAMKAQEIYRTVMRFLEGKYQSNTGPLQDVLEIPVQHSIREPYNPAATPMLMLRFRRVVTMGPSTSYAQSIDREDLKIYYDPNWEVEDKLVELLNK